ncbi:ABC transporter substrate-binding protein [Candidatus Daviesbacteria bacterium]|nr:ABC transporter substrate-binding protein [Candidatus Daviesbacteria bacterium]
MNPKNIRLLLLITWEYFKRKKVWIIASFAGLLFFIFLQNQFHLLSDTKTIKIGLVGTYQEHDLPVEITKLLSQGLVEATESGQIKPLLTKGWETNNDATQFKFKLKDNLKWADNSSIKVSDINLVIPNTTVSYPNDQTVQFNLKESYSPLPSLLIKPIFKKGTILLGTGPYKVAKVEKSMVFITKMVLQPNTPKLPVIQMRFYPNEKVAVTGFNLGEVQVLIGPGSLDPFSSNPKVKVKTETDYSKIVTILFRTTDKLLSSRSLRQALSYQTPEIPGEEVANNPYPPKFWTYNKEAKKYLSNSKEAKEALERAKSSVSEDKLTSELILTSTPNLSEVGKAVVKAWKELGFDSKLRVESGIPQNFQALLITQSIPQDPDQYFLWHATQTKTNLTKYDSKRVDKDLEDGRKLIPGQERRTKYFDFQKSLLEDAPAVFLYFPKYKIVYLKKVESLLDEVLKQYN